jgi:heme/copper-type cytochrome/quinol oxidase subunit 4
MSIFDKNVEHLYELNLSKYFGQENTVIFDDLLRMFCIQFTIQLMYFLYDPKKNKLLDEKFFEILFYMLLGITVYWLIIRKLFKIV